MSKICAKCSKTVYPLEELKCLDKVIIFIFIFQDMCDFEITQRLAHSAQFYIL